MRRRAPDGQDARGPGRTIGDLGLRLKSGRVFVCCPYLPAGKWISFPLTIGVEAIRPGLFAALQNQGAERVTVWA
jgi:hypothetical protein